MKLDTHGTNTIRKGSTSMSNKEVNRLEDLRRKLKQYRHKLLKMYRAEAIGIGYKHVGGKRTEEIAIIFFVKKKLSKDELRKAGIQQVPQKLLGYPTDIMEVGVFNKYSVDRVEITKSI